jgi:hypothetical protein
MSVPMPNDKILGGTCIASTCYREADAEVPNDHYVVVVLMPEAPFYKVCVVEDQDGVLVPEWTETHRNIVPAIVNEPSTFSGGHFRPEKSGYVDMGGDY